MTHDLLFALISFAFVTSVTPGPNNLMLMASGANFGFRRTVPHMLGISFGCVMMVFLFGIGVAGLFLALPQATTVLKVVSVGYMLWLAWKIAHSSAPQGGSRPGAAVYPMTFWQAAAFQWVNPKAWFMALGAVTVYAKGGGLAVILLVCGVMACINLPSIALWAGLGERLRHWLASPRRLAVFNWVMAGLLVLSLWPVLEF